MGAVRGLSYPSTLTFIHQVPQSPALALIACAISDTSEAILLPCVMRLSTHPTARLVTGYVQNRVIELHP
jgi:hypothetical protein